MATVYLAHDEQLDRLVAIKMLRPSVLTGDDNVDPTTRALANFMLSLGSNIRTDGQGLPDRWDAATGEGILWRVPLPGLAHSSPVVWGDRVYVTTAVSSDPKATFRRGLYGDGDASEDRSRHRWMVLAAR